jgi:hypothetical protein
MPTHGFFSRKSEHSWDLLRFSDPGRVGSVSLSADADIESIGSSFEWESDVVDYGQYELRDGRITFSITSTHGTVDYAGHTNDAKRLVLNLHSHINGYRAEGLEYSWNERFTMF